MKKGNFLSTGFTFISKWKQWYQVSTGKYVTSNLNFIGKLTGLVANMTISNKQNRIGNIVALAISFLGHIWKGYKMYSYWYATPFILYMYVCFFGLGDKTGINIWLKTEEH